VGEGGNLRCTGPELEPLDQPPVILRTMSSTEARFPDVNAGEMRLARSPCTPLTPLDMRGIVRSTVLRIRLCYTE
jgi:hypothetical protein